MSVQKENLKQLKGSEKLQIQSLIEKFTNYWPDLTITEASLKNPTPSFVYKCYSRIYTEHEKTLLDIRTTLLKQECEPLIDVNTYLDEITLGKKLRKLSQRLEISIFYLNDIFEPQPRRTIHFFIMFMNFLIYIKSDTEYKDEISALVDKAKSFQDMNDHIQENLEEIMDLNVKQSKLEDNLKKMSTEKLNISEKYEKISKQKLEKEFEHQKQIQLLNKLKENKDSSDEHLAKLRQEFILLQNQVVEETEVNELKIKISGLKDDLESLNINHNLIVKSLETHEKKAKHYNKCLEVLGYPEFSKEYLNNLNDTIQKICDVKETIKELNAQISSIKAEFDNLRIEVINLEKDILKSDSELIYLKKKTEKDFIAIEQNVIDLSEKVEHDLIDSNSCQKDITEIKSQISAVKDDMALLKAGIVEEYNEMIKCEAEIIHKFDQVLTNIQNENRHA